MTGVGDLGVARGKGSDPQRQHGLALIVLLTLLALLGLSLFVAQLGATQYTLQREELTAASLAEAAQELVADAVRRLPVSDAGYLRLPDLGAISTGIAEGYASGTFVGDGKDLTVIGKFPWRTLATKARRDRYGGCLWYVVSGRFKNDTDVLKTDSFNWDTLGQIDVIDPSGTVIATNVAALVVAPGPAVDGQSHSLGNSAYRECGGNYDARQYLDAFDSAQALFGQVNYFSGSINNRLAPNAANKQFVMADGNSHYNDQFRFITSDDLFNLLVRRSDFAAAIGILSPTDNPVGRLLDDPNFQAHLKTVVISGSKGTDHVDCRCNTPTCVAVSGDAFQTFCRNWKEMLFLTQLAAPTPITIDGTLTVPCARVLIFGGRRGTGQNRTTAADRSNPLNYLEGANAAAFAVPVATASSFSGTSLFNWRSPAGDLLRCLS